MVTQSSSLGAPRLQFDDGSSCRRWIASLPLTNLQSAQLVLTQQIALARKAHLPPVNLLRALEALREPVVYVQFELARKYAAKPLPLDVNESAMWARVQALWQEIIDAYLLCHDAHISANAGLKNYAPLIVMRCLRYTACAMFEYYRVYREAPAALWSRLCQLYAFAEQRGFEHDTVTDAFNHADEDASCAAAFCQALLAQLANPFALSGRQMEFVARWTENWSRRVNLVSCPPASAAAPAMAIDLATGRGPVASENPQQSPSLRYLDVEPLGRTLRQLITLLKQGQAPARLGLGDDARQPGCENLLMLLYIQWCRAGTGRGEERSSNTAQAQVCLGLNAVHFQLTGRAFRAPGVNFTSKEESDIQLFGRVRERTDPSSALESWRLVTRSNSGFMCMLRDPDAQSRIDHNQLLAVRCGAGDTYQAAVVQWLRVEENNEFFIGVRLFPGTPRAVAIRPANFSAPSGIKGFERALLLPELAAPLTPVTMILPIGWYQAGRFVEIHDGQIRVAKLVALLEKGSDFDRCAISLV